MISIDNVDISRIIWSGTSTHVWVTAQNASSICWNCVMATSTGRSNTYTDSRSRSFSVSSNPAHV